MILPFPLSLSEALAGRLVRYVEGGGSLIAECAPGRIDENGICPRGELSPALAALFGVRQRAFTMVREPDGGVRWSPPERTWGEYLEAQMLEGVGPLAGECVRANVYLQTFGLGAEGWNRCCTAGRRGRGTTASRRGQAWLLGTSSGTAAPPTGSGDPGPAGAAGSCDVCQARWPAVVRKRVTQDKEAWVLTNPTANRHRDGGAAPGWRAVTARRGANFVSRRRG